MKSNYKATLSIKNRKSGKTTTETYSVFADNLKTAKRLAERMKYALYNKDNNVVTLKKITKL